MIEFYSPFIVKIIDYGRCFVDSQPKRSQTVKTELCQRFILPTCNQDRKRERSTDVRDVCGYGKGFNFFSGNSRSFTTSNVRNISHDLRLANYCKEEYDAALKEEEEEEKEETKEEEKEEASIKIHKTLLQKLLHKIVYGQNVEIPILKTDTLEQQKKKQQFNQRIIYKGTSENISNKDPEKITNVINLATALEEFIEHVSIEEQNRIKYGNLEKYSISGRLTVYCDGSNKAMTYTML